MPVLSCLLPILNDLPSEETIEGILSQTFSDFELIIYSDIHRVISERYARKDARISLLPPIASPRTVADIYNLFLRKCSTPFFTIHKSGDISLPERFAEQIKHLKNSSLVVSGCAVRPKKDGEGKEIWFPNSPKKVLERQLFHPSHKGIHPFAAIRRKKIKTEGIRFLSESSFPEIFFDRDVQKKFPLRLSNIRRVLYLEEEERPSEPGRLDQHAFSCLHNVKRTFVDNASLFPGYGCL